MATSIHLYLRHDRRRRNGELPVYLRITHHRKHKYISTGVSVLEKHWNPDQEKIRKNHRNYQALNEILDNKVRDAQNARAELSRNGSETAKAIRDKLDSNRKADFFDLGDELLKDFERQKKFHRFRKIKVVLRKVEKMEGERCLPIRKVDTSWLEKFQHYLRIEHGNGDTTINKDFEIVRKIVQMALKSHLIYEDPFQRYQGVKRKAAKQKVKLSIEQIQVFSELDLEPDSWLWNTRNAFLFSFYSGGIRFGDICCLKWENIAGNRLSYRMNKNQKGFSTELNEFQSAILSFYSGEKEDYIFPFLAGESGVDDPMVLRQKISSKNVIANKSLKTLTDLVNRRLEETRSEIPKIEEQVSFHVSRHSFAQHAIESGLDAYELMQTLRHSKLETTQNYLKSLNEELADKAMKKIF